MQVDSDVVVMRATLDVVLDVTARLREPDRVELMLSTGREPMDCMADSFAVSRRTMAASVHGRPIAVFGIANALDQPYGIPWGVSTDEADRYPMSILRLGRMWIDIVAPFYPALLNVVHRDNRRSLRYVRALGFTIGDAEPFGPSGAMFHQIWRACNV
ncbi:MAG: hypothetical protein ACOC00_00130 [Halothiobacillaceae bacterium]